MPRALPPIGSVIEDPAPYVPQPVPGQVQARMRKAIARPGTATT